MKIEELIEKYERLNHDCFRMVDTSGVLRDLKQLDELKTGHTDEAPRYVKNILARLRELPLHDREVWLKVIISEFKQDFSRAKWREGYEQGKVEGMVERDKVAIPQFIADWIANVKRNGFKFRNSSRFYEEIVSSDDAYRVMYYILKESIAGEAIRIWVNANRDAFARAWLDGYEVEKEPKYTVKIKGISGYGRYLNKVSSSKKYCFASENEAYGYITKHTRRELEQDGFGEVFNSPLFEVEEVQE